MFQRTKFEIVSSKEWERTLSTFAVSGKRREFLFWNQYMTEYVHKNTSYKDIKIPRRATKYSAGYDFFAPCDIVIYPGEVITIPTGIKWNAGIEKDEKFLAIYPRSSLGRDYCLREPNIVSIIDADYYGNENNEGHIMINLKNEGTDGPVNLKQGEAYAQGIIQMYFLAEEEPVTAVRTGGFGSTNK